MNKLNAFEYQGQELELFAHAKRWKRYWTAQIEPWIRGDVLEVGAGVGCNTVLLQNTRVRSWHCLEPDEQLLAKLSYDILHLPHCSASGGTIASMSGRLFDSILYIDVLEHIEHDREELSAASALLRPDGHLIVLAPAHNFLCSEFDKAIGHQRRYNKRSLRACTPAGCTLEKIFYLDSAGIVISLANRLVLHQTYPTLRQIETWDSLVVPVSRIIDPLFGYTVGKSIVAVWTNTQ